MLHPKPLQSGQRVQRRRIMPMRYPLSQEIYYQRALYLLIKQMVKLIKKHIAPHVARWAEEATEIHLPTGPIRQDAWAPEMQEAVERILDEMHVPVADTIARLNQLFANTEKFNREEWKRLIRTQYGVTPTQDDPRRWTRLFRIWSEQNANLITNIPVKTMGQIAEQSLAALQEGKSVRTLTKEIFQIMDERVDVSLSRARLIARDQVAKLNGQFTQQRQEDIGVKGYIWRTVGDERVRQTHQDVDSKYFDWSNPPDETDRNHPGEDFQCRCWAEPVLPERVAFEAELVDEEAA